MDDTQALRRLADEYALCLDSGARERFQALFTPDARIVLHRTDGSVIGERAGPQGLTTLFDDLAVFDRTFHLVANHVADIDGDRATATTYCIAHHLTRGGEDGDNDLRCMIRYADVCERTADGWRIAVREVFFQWWERSPVR